MADAEKVAALRSLLSARFPSSEKKVPGVVPTGAPCLDEPLGGGLPRGRITELVSAAPSGGGQLLLALTLRTTRATRSRMALIDGADGFAPHALPRDWLRHLVWVRCRDTSNALAAADILVRDGNYSVLWIDLRGCAERSLAGLPATLWHRLHRAAEDGPSAVLVQTTRPLVPAVPRRLVLPGSLSLGCARISRDELASQLKPELVRGRFSSPLAELAG